MPPQSTDRIAITGMGVISPIGQSVDAFWSALVNGVSGISTIERFSTEGMRVKNGGEIKTLRDLTGTSEHPLPSCRASQFLILAADEALRMAHWYDPLNPPHPPYPPLRDPSPSLRDTLGVVIGTALGGIEHAEYLMEQPRDLHALTGALYDGPTRTLAHWLHVTGPVMTISTACASGATSLGVAADLLGAGTADAVIAGGVDILCRFVMQGFNRMRSLTRDTVRPFDRRRSGLLLGEGAGIVVLERLSAARQRGVQPLGFLLGDASCADGSHISAPDTAGRGLEHTMRLAMRNVGVVPEDIDFISAHGTGTPANDRVETSVFKNVLGARAHTIPINSIKAHMGHTMGAAATLETIMCLLASRHGQIPPTLNYGEADPECDLDYVPNNVRSVRPRISLKTAAGFAGCNACLVLEGAE
jgi:3-oxoacyl-[acyl-carrier-protein] synthase II